MLLDERLEAEVLVRGQRHNFAGRPYWELSLVGEDGQTLHLYEGQLKELPDVTLERGQRYTLTLRPFINNRWVEVKVVGVQAVGGGD